MQCNHTAPLNVIHSNNVKPKVITINMKRLQYSHIPSHCTSPSLKNTTETRCHEWYECGVSSITPTHFYPGSSCAGIFVTKEPKAFHDAQLALGICSWHSEFSISISGQHAKAGIGLRNDWWCYDSLRDKQIQPKDASSTLKSDMWQHFGHQKPKNKRCEVTSCRYCTKAMIYMNSMTSMIQQVKGCNSKKLWSCHGNQKAIKMLNTRFTAPIAETSTGAMESTR